MKKILFAIFVLFSFEVSAQTDKMMIRLSELEIDSSYIQEYNNILQIESRASVQNEPGVIAIFPMFKRESPTEIRILEIYANKDAYESHIKSPHFQKYKTSTLKMVKSLKLIDMESIDPETMAEIFHKLNK